MAAYLRYRHRTDDRQRRLSGELRGPVRRGKANRRIRKMDRTAPIRKMDRTAPLVRDPCSLLRADRDAHLGCQRHCHLSSYCGVFPPVRDRDTDRRTAEGEKIRCLLAGMACSGIFRRLPCRRICALQPRLAEELSAQNGQGTRNAENCADCRQPYRHDL